MERRREPRFICNQPAHVRDLATNQETEACLREISGRGARLWTAVPLAVNAPVRVDVAGAMLLGDVCYCRPEEGQYVVGVALAHSVWEMASLERLRRAVSGNPCTAAPEAESTEATKRIL